MTPQELEELRKAQGQHDTKLASDASAANDATSSKVAAAAGIASKMAGISSEGMEGGAISGAMAGSAFGAPGAVVGAIAGGVMGAAQSRAAAKAHNAQVEANKLAALGQIEEEKGKNIANVLSGMGARMSAGLR